MRIRGLGRLRRMVRGVRNYFRPEVVILMYHRVAKVSSDPWTLCVTPEHFAEHLDVLRNYGRPLDLPKLPDTIRTGTLPHRSVVITFDDGYADNLLYAKPLLERYDMPAIVFVTTGYLGSSREFWWDDLERIILEPVVLPEQLHLRLHGSVRQWNIRENDVKGYGGKVHPYALNGHRTNGFLSREALYRTLHSLLGPLSDSSRSQVMEELRTWAKVRPTVRPTHRILSSQEVVQLEEKNLIDIGAHTVTHPILSSLSVSEQESEIKKSKSDLEMILGRPVTTFTYPFGSGHDYRRDTVEIVRRAGFTCACSTIQDVVSGNSDLFQLPRFGVGDWDGETLDRRLKAWFRGSHAD